MINDKLRDKLSKIYELVNNGSTEGERAAAKSALDRIVEKYNLSEEMLQNLDMQEYFICYSTELDKWLLVSLTRYLDLECKMYSRPWEKNIRINLRYLDYITLDCMYQYFRRHMKSQWNQFCLPRIKKCLKAKTRNKKREELKELFFEAYIIKSKLIKQENLQKIDSSKLSNKEFENRLSLMGIEGGEYNKQVISSKLISHGS